MAVNKLGCIYKFDPWASEIYSNEWLQSVWEVTVQISVYFSSVGKQVYNKEKINISLEKPGAWPGK